MSEIGKAIDHVHHHMEREHTTPTTSGGCPYAAHSSAIASEKELVTQEPATQEPPMQEPATQEPATQEPATQPNAFVALSKFVVTNGTIASVKQAFRERPHLVDDVPGFLRLEVLSPQENESEIWLLTYWTDAQSFHTWHKSHVYREAHKGIPKGIKLDPRMTELRFFEYVCS